MFNVELPITEPAMIFAILAGSVFLIPPLAARLHLPSIVGLIFAGMVLGPNGFKIMERDPGGLIDLLGRAGLLYIMFLAGLEIDLVRFKKYRNNSLIFGTISFLIPQIVGAALAHYVLGMSMVASILLGSMLGSHTLLAYPVASRLGITRSTAVTTAVGGTIVTDVSALLVLAIIASSVKGELGVAFWVQLIVLLSIFLFLAFWILPRVARWFFRTVPADGSGDVLFVLTMIFLFASLARLAGVEPIIGAFVCGLALNPLIPETSPLASRVKFLGTVILIPLFLFSVGMLVNLGALFGGGKVLAVVAFMSITVVVTKWIAAFVGGFFLKYSATERWVMFGMTVNQAAATLAAVLVGVNIGLFDTTVLNGAIMMILISCLVGPFVTERWGRQLAAVEEAKPILPGEAPQRILMPLANPNSAEALVDLALMIRDAGSKEALYPLAVVPGGGDVEGKLAQIERLLSVAVLRGSAANVPMTPLTRVDSNIAEGIRRALLEQRISDVIIGWNGNVSLASRVFGTVLDQLLSHSRQLVMVARTVHPLNTTNRVILVIPRYADRLDSFEDSMRSIKVLTQRLSAKLLVLAPPREGSRLEAAIQSIKPEVPLEMDRLVSLRSLPDQLAPMIQDDDLLVLLSARSHRLSWAPDLDKLPRILAKKFDNLDFIVVYPSELEEHTTIEAPAPNSPLSRDEPDEKSFLAPSRIFLQADSTDAMQVLDDLVQSSLPANIPAAQLMAGFRLSLKDYPTELRDGIILIHTHQRGIPHGMLFIVSAKEGFQVPGFDHPSRAILAIVSPVGIPAAAHLRLLSAVAKCLRSDENLKALINVEDSVELAKILGPTLND